MENKDVLLIRKMISLTESIEKKIGEEKEMKEQVTNVAKTAQNISNILKGEKGLFSTLKNEIPALSKFKSAEELTAALAKGEIATADAYKIIKQANKVPEIAAKLKGFIGDSPSFKEVVKKVYPKGASGPVNTSNFKLASQTLQKTYGISAQEAEALLKKGASEMSSVTNVAKSELGGAKAAGKEVTGAKVAGKEAGVAKAAEKEVSVVAKEKPSAQQAAADVEKGIAEVKSSKAKKLLQDSKNKLKNLGSKGWGKLKNVYGKWSKYWLIRYGLVAAGVWYVLDRLTDGTTLGDDPRDQMFPKCVTDLLEMDGSDWGATPEGNPSIIVTKSGNADYDSKGGITFYTDNKVELSDKSKTGTWSCGGSNESVMKQEVKEAGTTTTANEISRDQMSNFIKTAASNLNVGFFGDQNVKNLESLLSIVNSLKGKTYRGQDAYSKFLAYYSQVEGDDFEKEVNSINGNKLGIEGIEAKEDLVSAMKGNPSTTSTTSTTSTDSPAAAAATTASGDSEQLGDVTITWSGAGGTGTGGTGTGETPDTRREPNYKKCDGFPYGFGCISEDIAYIQGCLGITPQKGYFGPKTTRTLQGLGYDISKGITQEIYKDIQTNKCGKVTPSPSVTTAPNVTSAPNVTTTPVVTPAPTTQPVTPIPGKDVYDDLKDVKDKLIGNVGEDRRIVLKDKGKPLSPEELSKLRNYMTQNGYVETKEKDKNYGEKIVWKLKKIKRREK